MKPASPIALQNTLPSGHIVNNVKLPCCKLNLSHASGGNCNDLIKENIKIDTKDNFMLLPANKITNYISMTDYNFIRIF